MKKEDIDRYLSKMKSGISDEEKIQISKEFYETYVRDHMVMNSDGSVKKFKDLTVGLMADYINSGALSLVFSTCVSEIENMAEVIRTSFASASSHFVENEKYLNEYRSILANFVKNQDALGKNPTQKQIDIYDEILLRHVNNFRNRNGQMDEETKALVKGFFSRLPNESTIRNTRFFKENLSADLQNQPDMLEVLPKKSKDDYEREINSFTRNIHGEIINFRRYDAIVNEYLTFYGNSVSAEKKQEYLRNIMDYQFAGEIHLSKTYTEYFSRSQNEEDKAILKIFDKKIIKECFARLYESDEEDIIFTDYESQLIDSYLERGMVKNPDAFDFNTGRGDIRAPSQIPGKTQLEKDLEFLFDSSDTDTIDIAKYIIRLKEVYSRRYSFEEPDDPIANKLYKTIKDMDITAILEQNLKSITSKNADANTRNANGLTVADCADIALELMLEANFSKGSIVISQIEDSQERDRKKNENKNRYNEFDLDSFDFRLDLAKDEFKYLASILNESGRNIYDSRAMRKMAELYVDRVDDFDNVSTYDKERITKYIETVAIKPGFNLFNEQGISDLLQTIAIRNNRTSTYYLNKTLKETVSKNPSYSISLDDAQKQADRFVSEFSNKPIDQSREADFDKFLIHLSKIKLESEKEKFVLPRKYVDFLLKQIIDPNSVVNMRRDKYTGVAERVVEDFAKLDNIDINGLDGFEYTYKTRDYLNHDRTMGVQYSTVIESKRDRIKRLFYGDLSPINTVYHENIHMTQRYRLANMPTDYKEYIMHKERTIRNVSSDYYEDNYKLYYMEIEARERAAQKTAAYIGKTLLPTSVTTIADSLRDDVVDLFSKKYRDMQQDYEKEAAEEATLYEQGKHKKDKDGETKTVHDILDNVAGPTKISNNISLNPGLRYEYEINGYKRTLKEQIDFALNPNFRINLDLMREIIRENYKENPNNTLGSLQAIIQYAKGNTNQKQNAFLEGILEDHLLIGIEKYNERISELTDNELNSRVELSAFYDISEVLRLHEEGVKLPAILTVPDEQGKIPIDKLRETAEKLQERVPNIEKAAEALHRFEYNEDGTKKTLDEQTRMFNTQKTGLSFNVIKESLESNRSIKDEGLYYLPNCFDKNIPDNKKKFYDDFLKDNLANHVLAYRDSLKNRGSKCKIEDIETYGFIKTLKNMIEKNDKTFSVFNSNKRLLSCVNETLDVIKGTKDRYGRVAKKGKWPDIEQKLEFTRLYYKQRFSNITDAMKFAKENPKAMNYELMADFIKNDGLVNNDKNLDLLKVVLEEFGSGKNTTEELDFRNRIIKENIATSVDNYMNEFQNNPDMKYIDVCEKYRLTKIFVNYAKKNPEEKLTQSLKTKEQDGKSGLEKLEELQKVVKEKYPNIDREREILPKYVANLDGKKYTFEDQIFAGLNPDSNIDLKLMRIAIRESGTITQTGSLNPLRYIDSYKMMANIGYKNYDGTYSSDLAKHYFVEDVINDNIHACIDAYQERLASGQEMDKEQLMQDYYTASFLAMDYDKSFMYMEGFRLGFQSHDKQGKTPITKLKEIRETLERMPGLQTEYNQYRFKEDGNQRSLAEMIDYARDNSGKIILPFMQTVARETDVAKEDNSLSALESLNKFIHIASDNREVDFINGVIKNCLPTCIDNFAQTLEDKGRKRTDSDLIAYQNIVTYLNTSKDNKKIVKTEQQTVPNRQDGTEQEGTEQTGEEETKKTITERLEEIKSMMDERWPGIDVAAAKLDSKRNKAGFLGRSTAYDQLKKIKVSAAGKNKAAEMEAKMAEKKQEIEYDG